MSTLTITPQMRFLALNVLLLKYFIYILEDPYFLGGGNSTQSFGRSIRHWAKSSKNWSSQVKCTYLFNQSSSHIRCKSSTTRSYPWRTPQFFRCKSSTTRSYPWRTPQFFRCKSSYHTIIPMENPSILQM